MSESAPQAASQSLTNSRLERLSRAHERQLVEIQQLREKLAEAEKVQAKLAKENTTLALAADESVAIKRANDAESELRGLKHRKVLDKVATAKGLNPTAVDGFYELSKYKAEGEPDEAKITEFVDAKKAELAYMFVAPPNPNAPPPVKPGPASGQGNGAAVSPFALSSDDPRVSDIKFQMENWAQIQAAKVEQMARGELR